MLHKIREQIDVDVSVRSKAKPIRFLTKSIPTPPTSAYFQNTKLDHPDQRM